MKKVLLSMVAGLMAVSASAQTAFTVTSDGKEYSFPINSTITVTDNELWKPEVVERQFKSNYKTLKASFQTSFSTDTQRSETGVTEYKDAYLIADHVWEIDFTTDDYKRVRLMVLAANDDTAEGNERHILANKTNTQANLGACNVEGTTGDWFSIKNFGKDGKWAWIYSELTDTYVLVSKDTEKSDAYDFSSLKATVDKVAAKDLNISNVSDKWKFLARVSDDNTAEKDSTVEVKFRANPETDRLFDLNGIQYRVNTGKVSMKIEGIDINASFPDEYDLAKGNDYDFRFWKDGVNDPDGFNFMLLAGTELPDGMDYSQTGADYPEFTIQDRNTLVSKNGMIICKYVKTGDNVHILKKIVLPAGTAIRRSSTYQDPVVKEIRDTIYVEKHDTIYIEKQSLTADELIKAGEYAESVLGQKTSLYAFKSDKEFADYASYYEQAKAVDTESLTDEQKAKWSDALEQLEHVATAYGYYGKHLMNPSSVGKYLMLGQGNVNGGMAFNRKLETASSTLVNGYSMSGGSGYVAYAKTGVDIDDESMFATKFDHYGRLESNLCFAGIRTIDIYVLYSPLTGKYTPVYLATQNGVTVEQWKGNTKNNFDTLEEATQHFGKNTGNMADRFWVKLNIDDEGARTVVANGASEFPDLSAFSDFSVVTTCSGVNSTEIPIPGVTVDTSKTPLEFSKDGEACEFSGLAVFTAKDSTGDKVALLVFKQGAKFYAYSYELAE